MKTLLVFFFSLVVVGLEAQPEKGNFMVGGNASLTHTMNDGNNSANTNVTYPTSTGFGITPTAGYFVVKNLALGATVSYSQLKSSYNNGTQDVEGSNNNLGVGPFARYYVPAGPLYVISEIAYGWSRQHSTSNIAYASGSVESENTFKTTNFRIATGTAIFLNKNASLDVLINYRKYDRNIGQSVLYLSVGFQLYFCKKQS